MNSYLSGVRTVRDVNLPLPHRYPTELTWENPGLLRRILNRMRKFGKREKTVYVYPNWYYNVDADDDYFIFLPYIKPIDPRNPVTNHIMEKNHPNTGATGYSAMYRPGNVTIACSIGQDPNRSIQNLDRGLVRKIADTFLHFIGYHRIGEPFRNRNLD